MPHHTLRVAAVAVVLTLWGCSEGGNGGTGFGGSGGQETGGKAGASTGTSGAAGSTNGLACRHGVQSHIRSDRDVPYCSCTLGATAGSEEWPDSSCGSDVLGGDVVCEVTIGTCICGLYWCTDSGLRCECGIGLYEQIPNDATFGSCKKQYCFMRGTECHCKLSDEEHPTPGSGFVQVDNCSAETFAAQNAGKIFMGGGFADSCKLLSVEDVQRSNEE